MSAALFYRLAPVATVRGRRCEDVLTITWGEGGGGEEVWGRTDYHVGEGGGEEV